MLSRKNLMENKMEQKNKAFRRMGNALAGLALVAGLSSCVGIQPTKGFNALYSGVNTSTNDNHTRIYTNVGLKTSNNEVSVNYHGLNQTNDFDADNYFGRHVLGIGSDEPLSGVEAVVDAKTTSEGLLPNQPFYGVRDFNIVKSLGGYGFVQATSDGKEVNLTTLYGRSFGDFNLELFNSYDYKSGEQDKNLTELLAQYNLNPNFGVFIRQDTLDLQFHDSSFVIGGVVTF